MKSTCKVVLLVLALSALSHAVILAAADSNTRVAPAAEADVSSSSDSQQNQTTKASPTPTPSEHQKHEVGVGFKIGTLGIGGEVAVALTKHTNLRGGVNVFRIDRTLTNNGITYDAGIHLGNGDVLFDWFPKGGGFHLSPGMLVYNGNKIVGSANVAGSASFTLNNVTYFSSATNPITGTGSIEVNKVAPMVMVGWGNLVPRTKHFNVSFEAGVLFWGSPSVNVALTGDVCASNQTFCRPIGSDPTVQGNLQAQIAKYNSDASSYKVYPVISFGIGYKF